MLGIAGARWKGIGSVILQSGEKVVYVDDEVQQGRVVMVMIARTKGASME